MSIVALFLLFCVSLIGTYIFQKIALRARWLDIPNTRSSHASPTPRGAGVVFVVVFYCYALYLYLTSDIEPRLFFALLGGVVLAVIGFWDDIRPLDASVRLGVHILVAILAIVALWSEAGSVQERWGYVLGAAWIVMMINVFNFLDGIDGYAVMQGIVIALTAAVFFHSPFGVGLGAVLAGFLVFNWHKASVFMGDAGSTVLGYWFGVLSLYHFEGIVLWLSVSVLFWVDAILTILKRLGAKEPIWQAHKKHAYQKLVRMGWSHDKVVLGAVLYYGLVLTALGIGIDPLAVLFVALIGAVALWILVQLRCKRC